MSEELKPVEVADEIKAVMEDENFVPSSEDVECYGKHQIKPSDLKGGHNELNISDVRTAVSAVFCMCADRGGRVLDKK